MCVRTLGHIPGYMGRTVNCVKITKDKSSNNKVHTSDARLIKAIHATPRRETRNSRPSIIVVSEREAQNSRLNTTAMSRRGAQNLRPSITAMP